MWFSILLLLLISVVHCAIPLIYDVSLITMVLLITGGNVGWFAFWHLSFKNPEQNLSKNLFPGNGKELPLALPQTL